MDIAACDLEQLLDHKSRTYTGQIYKWRGSSSKIDPKVIVAECAYANAVRRCNDRRKYPTYEGIKVLMGKREFIYWWIIQTRFLKLTKPSLGRIDHDKDYSFENIKLEEHSDNSKEVFTRHSPHKSGTKINIFRKGAHVAVAKSMHQASVCTNITISKISEVVSGKYKQAKGWGFTYVD